MTTSQAAVIAVLCFVIGYLISTHLTKYKLMRFKRWVKCQFGKHVPGRVQAAPGGRNVQRCDWCDKVVREYQVTPGEARQQIRRIY